MNKLLKLNRIINYLFLFGWLGIVGGCISKLPDYPDQPSITFEGFVEFRDIIDPLSTSFADSIILKVKFQDGDGDLGLDEEDKQNNPEPNFYMQSFLKGPTGFTESVLYTGQFQQLSVLAKTIKGPIDGTLFYSNKFQHVNFSPNDTLKFFIYIKDRAGNLSNSVETGELIIRKQ